jgi:hypothetical protein
MKGQIVVQVNDDDTIMIQSTKPKDVRRPMLSHYTFQTLDKAIEKAASELKAMQMVGDITLLQQ